MVHSLASSVDPTHVWLSMGTGIPLRLASPACKALSIVALVREKPYMSPFVTVTPLVTWATAVGMQSG
jgi:hypothetical protein